MGRKKSSVVTKPPFRPFCYYCERDFESEKVLIQHQKLKHFQCYVCHRKSDTARGLVGHMLQVHKESMHKVPNSIVGRDDPEIAIHGLDGVPNHIIALKAKGTLYEDELARKRAVEYAASMTMAAASQAAPLPQGAPYGSYFPFPVPPPVHLLPAPPAGMFPHPVPISTSGLIPPPPPPGVPRSLTQPKRTDPADSKYVT